MINIGSNRCSVHVPWNFTPQLTGLEKLHEEKKLKIEEALSRKYQVEYENYNEWNDPAHAIPGYFFCIWLCV